MQNLNQHSIFSAD